MGTKKKAPKKRAAQKKLSPQQEARSESTSIQRLAHLADQSTALARLVARNPKASGPLLKQLGAHSDATVRKWVTSHPNTPPEVLVRLASQFPEQLLDNVAFDMLLLENPNLLEDLPKATRRSLLKREKCPVSFLEWLAQDDDEGVQLALAMNPNTPEDVLYRLGRASNERVAQAARSHINFRHPVETRVGIDLEELRRVLDAELLGELVPSRGPYWRSDSERRVEDLLSARNTRSELLPWLIANQEPTDGLCGTLKDCVRRRLEDVAFAQNRHTAPEILIRMAREGNALVKCAVAQNPSSPVEALQILVSNQDDAICEAVARHPSVDPGILKFLAKRGNEKIREIVASRHRTPPEVLRILARDQDADIRERVSLNPNVPAAALNYLANDKWEGIRTEVAGHPNCPPQALKQLARDGCKDVREAVALHPSVTDVVLGQLAKDRSSRVRELIAANVKTPAQAMTRLARDRSLDVKMAVAENPKAPPEALKILVGCRSTQLRQAVARHHQCPKELLVRLARSGSHIDKRLVAANPNAPPAALRALAGTRDLNTRRLLATNPATPDDVLNKLYDDKNAKVSIPARVERKRRSGETERENRCESADAEDRQVGEEEEILAISELTSLLPRARPDYARLSDWRHLASLAPNEMQEVCELRGIKESERDKTRRCLENEFIERYGRAKRPSFSRLACLLLPNCRTTILAKAGRSPDWKERLAIACHPKTPPAIRQRLANDGNRFVRAAAQQAIEEISE